MSEPSAFSEELARRMDAPQRHRLLQGYPMVPLMRHAAPEDQEGWLCRDLDGRLEPRRPQDEVADLEPPHLSLDAQRPIIIGVIPHTHCNPRLRGCGFCTFGQDPYSKPGILDSVAKVGTEIGALVRRWPQLAQRRVDAVYFGGGTANLTPPRELRQLFTELSRHFDLRAAEVTLEGVPALFRSLLSGPLEALLDVPARHHRISMGVQTFAEAQLKRMGRERFGDRKTVERVVEKAHRNGLTVSGDFLFNLPFQTLDQMREDVRIASELGLDQICIYHLVLHPDQGTPWAKNPSLIAALPPLPQALANWLALREQLLAQGFVQTTLTNFERAAVNASPRRFVYEEHSFTPQTYDALGFGPLSITTMSNLAERRAIKFMRSRHSHARDGRWGTSDFFFPYAEEDLKLLFITRSLPRLRIDRAAYRDIFAADLAQDFDGPISACVAAGLVILDEKSLNLTPRGMFFADSVAGLIASRRAAVVRGSAAGLHTKEVLRETVSHSMG